MTENYFGGIEEKITPIYNLLKWLMWVAGNYVQFRHDQKQYLQVDSQNARGVSLHWKQYHIGV